MNWELGNSGHESNHSDVVRMFLCEDVTERDLNTTVLASQLIASISSALFYLAIFSLSIIGVCFKSCVKVSSSQGTFFVFLVGALIASVNVFTNANDLQVKEYYRIFTVSLIGIVFTLFGALLFFKRPAGVERNQPTLGRHQPSMGLVVALITFPLIVIEIVLVIAAAGVSKKTVDSEPAGPLTYKPWFSVMVVKSLFPAQKIIQALIYLYLRNTTICQEYKENAQFYFRTLSFFNLIEWVDSQVNLDSDIQLSGLGQEFVVVGDLYKALVIDYRLLCSLLFLEHSVDIQTEDNEVEANGVAGNSTDNTDGTTESNMTSCDRQIRCIGYVVGCVCLIAPLFCALYYVPKFHLKPWVNAFAIVVNLAIVACGTCLLCNNDLYDGGNKESHGVKIMVCCLGAVGFTCWMIKAAIACYWAATVNDRDDIADSSYIRWDATKFAVRCVTTAFLMGLFMKVNARAFPLRNATTKMNHLLVPAVMLGIISVFCESLIDQYIGLDKIISCEIKEQTSLKILFEVGPPMYLGFLIHVCLHFVIIETSIGKSALTQCQTRSSSTTSLYMSTRDRSSTISDYLDAEADHDLV